MSRKLTLEKRKFALNKYWKTEKAQDVIRDWCLHFSTDPPTRLTIYQIRDKFEETGSVTDAPLVHFCLSQCVVSLSRVYWSRGLTIWTFVVIDFFATAFPEVYKHYKCHFWLKVTVYKLYGHPDIFEFRLNKTYYSKRFATWERTKFRINNSSVIETDSLSVLLKLQEVEYELTKDKYLLPEPCASVSVDFCCSHSHRLHATPRFQLRTSVYSKELTAKATPHFHLFH